MPNLLNYSFIFLIASQEKVIECYTMAVEMILSIEDKQKGEKVNKFARQALETVQKSLKELKRKTRPTKKIQ
jgi:hypothetical protein